MDPTPAPVTQATPQPVPPALVIAWPRSAQLATAFLLGLATALLAVQITGSLRWGARPTELDRTAVLDRRIDLNRAGRAELLQIPGVGAQLAERIEAHRRARGPFRQVEELAQVPGIGPATLERVRPWIYVSTDAPDEDAAAIPAGENVMARADPPAAARAPASKKETQLTARINVNTATQEELQRLPGIGPKLSERIIEERRKAPFKTVEDLRRVYGIGPKTLEKLKPHVSVAGEAVATAE